MKFYWLANDWHCPVGHRINCFDVIMRKEMKCLCLAHSKGLKYVYYDFSVLVLCTQVNMMFVMLL